MRIPATLADVNPALFQQPFFQVTLPIMVTFVATMWIAQWAQNKRFDDMKREMDRRFDEVIVELRAIKAILQDHGERITRLEERTSPLGRGR